MKYLQISQSTETGKKHSLSIAQHNIQERRAETKLLEFSRPNKLLEMASPDETLVKRLNELAKKYPFCAYRKNKKHDPL